MSDDVSSRAAGSRNKTVAVVVPLYPRDWLTPDEEISFRHMLYYLGNYDKYLIIPKSSRFTYPGFKVKPFSDKFFGSAERHSKLLAWPRFYEAFADYKYMLLHQPDALVFSDQLMEWCATDLDYIGAPWFRCDDTPHVSRPRVGNMGFSLLKIESFLRVFYSTSYTLSPGEYWEKYFAGKSRIVRLFNLPRRLVKRMHRFNGARWYLYRHRLLSDIFWSDHAVHYYPDFKVAPFEVGLRFSFEVAPRICFRLNNYQLPFACHAWTVYDREFWEPYLLPESSTVS